MIKLYSYFRSTAAYRVRIALNYKKLPHQIIPVNLIQDKQHAPDYTKLNPHARVPTLIDDDFTIGQSFAILEYLEEKYPMPHLLPQNIEDRARIRYLAQIIVCDMHPLNNSGSISYLKENLHHSQEEAMQWYFHWLKKGFDSLEALVKRYRTGHFCIGDEVSLADVCLIPQIYNAFRFGFEMKPYPTLMAVHDYCLTLDYFNNARPENQIDFVDRAATKVP